MILLPWCHVFRQYNNFQLFTSRAKTKRKYLLLKWIIIPKLEWIHKIFFHVFAVREKARNNGRALYKSCLLFILASLPKALSIFYATTPYIPKWNPSLTPIDLRLENWPICLDIKSICVSGLYWQNCRVPSCHLFNSTNIGYWATCCVCTNPYRK